MDRRSFLRGAGTLGVLGGFAPRLAFAKAATAKRFVFIIQRGAKPPRWTRNPLRPPSILCLTPTYRYGRMVLLDSSLIAF